MRQFVTYLLVSIAFLGTQIASSQPTGTSKTVAIPEKDALKVLQKGYEAKALEQQRDLLLNHVDTLKARIVIKDMIILNLNGQIADYKNIIQSHTNIVKAAQEQRTILEQQLSIRDKELKKQRRKTKWTAFLGIITTSAAITLYLLK
jgi:L-cysteine desulfidase